MSRRDRPRQELPFTTYQDALDWLVQHYNLERQLGGADVEPPTLDRMRSLVGLLGDPQDSVPAIHVTGTNGKGSTSRMAVELLGAVGLDAGSYSSPHITRVNDRIAVANEPLSDDDFRDALREVAVVEPFVVDMAGAAPNYFEVLSAAAFNWFAANAVDVNVIEVGMGGRWDATNVVDAEVAVVTNIGADHLEIIGPTLADVAMEKAGIIGPNSHVICGEPDADLAAIIAGAGGRELWQVGVDFDVLDQHLAVGGRVVDLFTPYGRHEEVYVPVHGRHQAANLATAVAAVEAFFGRAIDDDVLRGALAELKLPARFEVLGRQPLMVVDGAHNAAGAAAAAQVLFSDFASEHAPVLVVGCNRPHDPAEFLTAVRAGDFGHVIATAPNWPRAVPSDEVAKAGAALGLTMLVEPQVDRAVDRAVELAGAEGSVLVTGSLYVASEARVHLLE